MKDTNTSWHGIDKSKEISLLEYGLLVRWDRSKKTFQCIYKAGIDKWGITFISTQEIDELVLEDWFDLGGFQKYIGIPLNVWINEPFVNKLQNLLGFISYTNVFGMIYLPKSTREVCKLARVEFSPEYAFVE